MAIFNNYLYVYQRLHGTRELGDWRFIAMLELPRAVATSENAMRFLDPCSA